MHSSLIPQNLLPLFEHYSWNKLNMVVQARLNIYLMLAQFLVLVDLQSLNRADFVLYQHE